ncbi:MAG: hypothetical protein LIP77_09275 [Planctomycetes bacterium]|nr:hypothetical protein [Planctomycetota bacterium]
MAPDPTKPEQSIYLGIDVGTTGVKVALVGGTGKILGIKILPHETSHPHPGWAEQDPNQWWNSIVHGVTGLLADANADETCVRAMAVSSMTPCLLGVDSYGEAFIAHTWADQRAVAEAQQIRDRVGDARMLELCGNASKAVYLAPKIMWLKKHMPDVYKHTKHFLSPAAYIGYRLTGVAVTTRSDSEITLLHDKRTGMVVDELCDAFGIDAEKIPPTRNSDQLLGALIEKAATELCLPPGTPVAVGGHDSPASAYALGVTEPGDMFLDVGNAANLGRCVAEPVTCQNGDLYHHAVGDAWILQVYAAAIGSSLRWYAEQFGGVEAAWAAISGQDQFDLLCQEAAQSPPGANGVVFLPYLQGTQSNPDATGSFHNIRSSTTRRDMARAVLEGCAFQVRRNLDRIEDQAGDSQRRIYLGGGGSKNDIWNNIFADILNREIAVSAVRDAAVTGAAMLAALAVGESIPHHRVQTTYQPKPENRDIYETRYREFLKLSSNV